MNKKNNRKGQVFVVMVIIAVTGALLAAAIILHSLYQDPNPDQFLGRYQSAIADSMNDGDKILTYIDEASKMSVSSAFDEYLNGNPNPLTNVEGGDPATKYCGSYVYRLWNTLNQNCYPDYQSSDFELNALIDKHFSDLTRNMLSSKDNPPEEKYFDSLIQQDVNYEYSYIPSIGYTNIIGSSEDQYTVNVFKSKDTATDTSVQNYLTDKSAYTGSLIWPLANNFEVSSCFGYRGTIDTLSGVAASTNHPGLDIPAPKGTEVHAAASGTVESILYPAWGKVVINHGGGLKTGYMHMDSIAPGLQVGSVVKQGDVIGYVGGRGPDSANDYENHLHFEVTSATVDLNTNYLGISGVIITANGNYVNPMCFIDQNSLNSGKITFDMSSKACNSICNSASCAKIDPTDTANSPPYKFCSVYEGVTLQKPACIKTGKTDWKIENIALSGISGAQGTAFTSDQTMTISMTIENDADTCVTVQPELSIFSSSDISKLEIMDPAIQSVNVYPKTDLAPQTTVDIVNCTFTTDKTVYMKAVANKKCVLYAPDDGSIREYSLNTKITDFNNAAQSYDDKLKFTVKKGTHMSSADTSTASSTTNTNAVNNNNQASVSTLSNSDKAKFDATKTNLEPYMADIDAASTKFGIDKNILLGLITQESSGVNFKINIPKNNATGILQVEGSKNYNTIQKVCGKEYISECGTAFSTCKFEKYGDDISCQINVGAQILKDNYDRYTNDDTYKKTVLAICHNPVYQQQYLSYTGWQRALRAYNGFGCNDVYATYVELVMKWASAWGYIDTTNKQTKDEMFVGILGQYHINPVFNVKLDFDMSLLDRLKKFANDTVSSCGKEGMDRMKCIQDNVDAFNNNLPQEYKQAGVVLKTTCDTSDNMAEVNNFVEKVDDCMSSPDDMCKCDLNGIDSYAAIQSVESVDGSTKISYYSDEYSNELTNAYFDYSIIKNKQFFSSQSTWLNTITLYKNNTRLQTDFITDKKCGYVKSAYRLCLATTYSYDAYTPAANQVTAKITKKFVTIPFAIMVRDNVAPKPIVGVESQSMPHSKNSIILKWNAGTEGDIVRYNIYLSDSEFDFIRPTANLRKTIAYKSISSMAKDYIEYKSIDFTNPICVLKEDTVKGIQYCAFNNTAIDKDGKTVSIQLEKEKLYYVSTEKKFVYILDGTKIDNTLATGTAKFIAVTATDIDGNEIDNIDSNQKIVSGTNLIKVTPEDKLEAGFANVKSSSLSPDKTVLTLSWDKVGIYIDGTPIADASLLTYDIYVSDDNCVSGKLNDVLENSQEQSTPNTDIAINLKQSKAGLPTDYCVYVLPDINNNKYMKGFGVNTRDLSVGLPSS